MTGSVHLTVYPRPEPKRNDPIVDATIRAGRYVATSDPLRLPAGVYYCVMETPTQRMGEREPGGSEARGTAGRRIVRRVVVRR